MYALAGSFTAVVPPRRFSRSKGQFHLPTDLTARSLSVLQYTIQEYSAMSYKRHAELHIQVRVLLQRVRQFGRRSGQRCNSALQCAYVAVSNVYLIHCQHHKEVDCRDFLLDILKAFNKSAD